MAYFHCYPDNFLGGLQGLSEEQCAAYVRIILKIYATGKPLKNDPRQLRHLLEKKDTRPVTRVISELLNMGKLTVDAEGFLHNDKADRELEKFGTDPGQRRGQRDPQRWGQREGQRSPQNGAKNAMDPTRARTLGHAPVPEDRSHIRERSLSNSSSSAQEPESFNQVIARRLAEARQKERAKEIGPDATRDKD